MFENNFMDDYLYGDAKLEDLDDYIEYWHTHDTKNTLGEFLGITSYEYNEWLKNNDHMIRDILDRRNNEFF